MRRRWQTALAVAVAAIALAGPSAAHDGPPFPMVEDRRVGPYEVEVWTDPDIGTGTFFVVLQSPEGTQALPEPLRVQVTVEPVSGRLPPAVYAARRGAAREGLRYDAEVAFDRGEWWHVAVGIDWPGGSQTLTSKVEATPDGQIGPVGLVIFALPFAAVGALWLKASRRRRALAQAATRPRAAQHA